MASTTAAFFASVEKSCSIARLNLSRRRMDASPVLVFKTPLFPALTADIVEPRGLGTYNWLTRRSRPLKRVSNLITV